MHDIIGIRHRPFTHPVGTVEQQAANVPAPQAQADNAAPNPTAVSDAAGRLPQIPAASNPAATRRFPCREKGCIAVLSRPVSHG